MFLKSIGISAVNFALAKAICGDTSDNIKGVKGVGFKTVIKLFPSLAQQVKLTLDDLFKVCENEVAKGKERNKKIQEIFR
jgi:5'-3' exonuclease